MSDLSDQQLLRDYADHRSEAAFSELVRRHIGLVYSAAFRMTGEAHSAQDVTQAVFVALAQNTPRLACHPVLSGWLHTTARNLAAKNIRDSVRRQHREQEAAAMNEPPSSAPEVSWNEIAPQLDIALGELSEADRDAVLLRYFERKSTVEIAKVLGVSDDTAQKRVSRAVEKLREYFTGRKITISASGLAALIAANAVQAAPAGLAGTAVSTSTAITATKIIAITTLQKALITATVAIIVGAGIYEARQAAQLREQNQTLQQQQVEQIRQLQHEYDDATNRPANLSVENARLKTNSNQAEVLKLRGEIGGLRHKTGDLLEKNQALQSQAAANESTNDVSTNDRLVLLTTHANNAMTTLLAAAQKYATNNGGQNPVNIGQLIASGELKTTNFVGNLGLGDFEFAEAGATNWRGDKIIFLLRNPLKVPGKPSVTMQGCINDGLSCVETFNISSE